MHKARVFKSGGSEAVHIPKEYRFKSNKDLVIRKIGNVIMIYPLHDAWNIMRQGIESFTDDFMAERNQPTEVDQREEF